MYLNTIKDIEQKKAVYKNEYDYMNVSDIN